MTKDENADDKKRKLLKDAQTKIDEKENALNTAGGQSPGVPPL